MQTYGKVLDMLRDIVAENPERQNTKCLYYDPEDVSVPMCVVGQVFDRLGLLASAYEVGIWAPVHQMAGAAHEDDWWAEHFEPNARGLLSDVQVIADGMYPWSQALEHALVGDVALVEHDA